MTRINELRRYSFAIVFINTMMKGLRFTVFINCCLNHYYQSICAIPVACTTMSVFKYKFEVSQQTQLKSSHQKRLVQSLKKQYPYVKQDTWKLIFPSKSSALMTKLSNNIILYQIKLKTMSPSDKVPIFFFQMKVNGEDCVYPTLYLLWKVPNFLPCICIHSPVSQFILRGADLMLPGVARQAHRYYTQNTSTNTVYAKDLSTVRVNDVFSIKVIGNPLPIAIGYSILCATEISGDGAKGRFMKMMHIFRDQLWEFGGKVKPNAGFLSKQINPLETQKVPQMNESKRNDDANASANEQDEKDTFDTKFNALSMDNKLIYGFFATLLSISSGSLPVVVSDVYQSMRQNKNTTQFKTIDVKQTSWNKLARFAQNKQFESLMECKAQKSKVFVHSTQPKAIARHLLLILNHVQSDALDAIIAWFEQNWDSLTKSDQNDNSDNEVQETESELKSENVRNETPQQRFKAWFDTQNADTNASSIIGQLFGGWDRVLECNDIHQAFVNHLSDAFDVMLSDTAPSDCRIDLKSSDQVFKLQFLQTLKESVDPDALPVSASTWLTRRKLYILKPDFVFSKRNLLKVNLNEDIITSVRQTRWRKSAKFLKDLSKQNIIQLKDYGNTGGELMITGINYHYLTNKFNPKKELSFFTPQAFEKFCAKINELKAKESGSERKENEEDKEQTQFMASDRKQTIKIQTMYRANHRLLPIFGEKNISPLHSKNKARTFLWSYIAHNRLMAQNKQYIVINEALFHMLYDSKLFHNKKRKNKEKEKTAAVAVGGLVHRKDLVKLFDEYMQPYSAIILDEDEEPRYKPGYPPKIEITADKRQGTKFMTHVVGLEVYGIDCNEFAVTAKKYFAAAVTTSSLHGKKAKMKGGKMKRRVSIQGNMVKDVSKQDVPTLLSTHYGIPNQFINAKTNITKQPKK
eukprot:768500_1